MRSCMYIKHHCNTLYIIYIGIRFARIISTASGCFHKIVSYVPATNEPVCGPVSFTVTVSPSDGVVLTQLNASIYDVSGLADIVYTIRWIGIHDGHLSRLGSTTGKFIGIS